MAFGVDAVTVRSDLATKVTKTRCWHDTRAEVSGPAVQLEFDETGVSGVCRNVEHR
ncbi:MAG: hypothetical protein JOZ87_37305 [Chloroflexi bacterium]|nr:hypothetical protein [Chloroflexota bacterium]